MLHLFYWLFTFIPQKKPSHQKAKSNQQSKHPHCAASHLATNMMGVCSTLNKQPSLPCILGLSTTILLVYVSLTHSLLRMLLCMQLFPLLCLHLHLHLHLYLQSMDIISKWIYPTSNTRSPL